MMFGYACSENDSFMPSAIYYSHKITKSLSVARHNGQNWMGPDGKAQVTDHVLKDFSEEEKQELQDIVNCIINSITILIDKKLDLFSFDLITLIYIFRQRESERDNVTEED